MPALEYRSPMEVEVKGVPVYYETRGEGRPLVMLHGWPADHHHMVRDFEPFFEHREGWQRVYPDLPGMGRTPGADWITNLDGMLDVLLEFIDQAIPGERFAVAGTSSGGYMARGVAHRRAERMDGLLLLVPQVVANPRQATVPPPTTLIEDPGLRDELAPDERWLYDWAVVPDRGTVDALREFLLPAVERADLPFMDKLDQPGNAAFSFDVDRLPAPFPAPALFLTGRQDSVVGYRDAWDIVEDYPRATFAVLDRAGHFLGDNQEVLFKTLVSEWLDRVEEFAARA